MLAYFSISRQNTAVLPVIFGSLLRGKPIQNHWQNLEQVPATSSQSEAMSKELKKRGFKFVGSTTCYAFMQATGMVNDHTTDCFRHEKISAIKI